MIKYIIDYIKVFIHCLIGILKLQPHQICTFKYQELLNNKITKNIRKCYCTCGYNKELLDED